MTIRPIIFSAPMVRALLAGRKTQTRRLATSPLAIAQTGDLLWVRERTLVLSIDPVGNGFAWLKYEADDHQPEHPVAIPERLKRDAVQVGRRLSMGCFREASRITLELHAKTIEPLQAITEADAMAEGLFEWKIGGAGLRYSIADTPAVVWPSAVEAYAALWGDLHTTPGHRWADNPDVVALTFSALQHNVDRLPAGAIG